MLYSAIFVRKSVLHRAWISYIIQRMEVDMGRQAIEIAPVLRGLSGRSAVKFFEVSDMTVPPADSGVVYVREGEDVSDVWINLGFSRENPPRIVLVQNVGGFALADSKRCAELLIEKYNEVKSKQSYRIDVFCDDMDTRARMRGKICVVTGGAQGFGAGIATGIAKNGGFVVIADMNKAGADAKARELNEMYGDGCAIGAEVNVTDEISVKNMIDTAVLNYGGVDVMVSCAGIVIAGDLTEMTESAFEKVTKVNYTGYFFCAKYASIPMKLQRKHDALFMGDIIEINSKSGLEGSKANFAYAGSKFGGIGLTQSFALELAPFGIKVNALCPGNLLDGPLWSDPDKGLFKQYLDAGKVPGAKTVADVRKFYESKVPLGRGCTEHDVVIALMYVVEQAYETGQALPVTGGQVMMS